MCGCCVFDVRNVICVWLCLFSVSHGVWCMYPHKVICVFLEKFVLYCVWCVPCDMLFFEFCVCVHSIEVPMCTCLWVPVCGCVCSVRKVCFLLLLLVVCFTCGFVCFLRVMRV